MDLLQGKLTKCADERLSFMTNCRGTLSGTSNFLLGTHHKPGHDEGGNDVVQNHVGSIPKQSRNGQSR